MIDEQMEEEYQIFFSKIGENGYSRLGKVFNTQNNFYYINKIKEVTQ